MLADVLGHTVVGPRHRENRVAIVAGAKFSTVFQGPHPLHPFLDVTYTDQEFVKFGAIGSADFALQIFGIFEGNTGL